MWTYINFQHCSKIKVYLDDAIVDFDFACQVGRAAFADALNEDAGYFFWNTIEFINRQKKLVNIPFSHTYPATVMPNPKSSLCRVTV